MSKKLRVGAVGIGGIFNAVHSPAWLGHKQVELVAVCDIKGEKAETYAKANKISQVYTDYKEMIKKEELDVVDICTPNLLHSEIAVAALNAGRHVFCEKPDAVSISEAKKMADAAQKSGKTLMAMRNNRFRPESQWLKRYITEGHAGDIYTGRCGWIRRRGIPGKGGWFTTKAMSGGGPLIDLGVHMMDLAIWLMGNPVPVSVTGATYCKFANAEEASDSVHAQFGEAKADGIFDVEDLATGFIRFANGATLQLEVSWASNIEQEDVFVELRGSKAGIKFSHQSPLKVFSEVAGGLVDIEPHVGGDGGQQHARHINHFVDVLLNGAKPVNTPQDGVHMISVLSALYESAASGREVRIG